MRLFPDHLNLLTAHIGSTVIVFEASQSGLPGDTLIQAREEIEVRWVSSEYKRTSFVETQLMCKTAASNVLPKS